MSFISRLFGRSERVTPHPIHSHIQAWETLTESQMHNHLGLFSDILHSKLSNTIEKSEIYILDDSFCKHDRGMCVEEIPYSCIIHAVKSVTDKPFIISPLHKYFALIFVQNLEKVTAILAPSVYLAMSLVKNALHAGGECPITHEPFSELNEFCVAGCGHVYSIAARGLPSCAVCREPIAITNIKRSDLD
jgi:hypothetical protein